MLRPICAILGLLAATAVASAADMPVKAAPKAIKFTFPYDTSGFYVGGGAGGEATRAQINAGGVAGVASYAAGGNLHGLVGYTFAFGPNRWIAAEGLVTYSGTAADLTCAGNRLCSFTSRLGAEQRFLYGGDVSVVTQWLPDLFGAFPTLPMVPGTDTNPIIHPYVGGFVREAQIDAVAGVMGKKKFNVTYGPTMGFLTKLKNGGVIDTFAEMDLRGDSIVIGPGAAADPKTTFRVGMTYKMGISRN